MKLNKKGFTLIELLAVIVIIAIIALIGIPSVTTIINNSRKDAIKSTGLAMISAARNALAADNITVSDFCYMPFSTLNMENANMPSGGTIKADDSYVKVSASDGGNTLSFEVTLLSNRDDGMVAATQTELQNTTTARAKIKTDGTAIPENYVNPIVTEGTGKNTCQ